MHILILLNQFGSLIIALVVGLYVLRYMSSFHRALFIGVVTYIFILIVSYLAELIPGMHRHNQWVFNIYLPIDTGIYCWAAYEYFKLKRATRLIWLGYLIVLMVFIPELIIKGPLVVANHGFVAESILLVVLYLIVLYREFTTHATTWRRTPELWISLGIVIYNVGVIPYFSLFSYLQRYYPKIDFYLLTFINDGLSHVVYLLLAYGFWLVRRNAIAKTATAHE